MTRDYDATPWKQLKARVLDDELFEHIASLPEKEQWDYLFLTRHPRFEGRWEVNALNQAFFFDFEEQIGKYRTVSPASLERFLERADDLDYQVVFEEDPLLILNAWGDLNEPPAFKLDSDMAEQLREKGFDAEADVVDATGMLPFQLQGFNFLRREGIRGGIALWSTGVGKTALEAALIKQHLEVEDYDLAVCVVKRNNKYDTHFKLKALGRIESYVIEGTPKQRAEMYELIDNLLAMGDKLVLITNYEKLRDDHDDWIRITEGRNVIVFWDEMPTKLSNRSTQLYDSVRDVLYDMGGVKTVDWEKRRPSKLRQYDLTATPIENSPVGLLNQVRLLDPDIFPTISGWEKRFVATRNFFSKEPETFKNLDEFGLMIEFITHQVDKRDPDIAKLFPAVKTETKIIDWERRDRAVYDRLQQIAAEAALAAKKDPEVKKFNPLQLISVMQMLCDAPSMVQASASNREAFEAELANAVDDEERIYLSQFASGSEAALTLLNRVGRELDDKTHTKFEGLKELLLEKHPGEKTLLFSRYSHLIFPALEAKLKEWDIPYVVYQGTDKQRQEAKEKFRTNPEILVFLSSDAGSDSIDLPEAKVVIHYDLPLKWATLIQRQNRAHRVNSEHESVTFYVLLMANSIEQRILEIVMKKWGFHEGTFRGKISEEAISARMTADDLWYILTGERLSDTLDL
jgi:SNF2 family DNA or RNA helicase